MRKVPTYLPYVGRHDGETVSEEAKPRAKRKQHIPNRPQRIEGIYEYGTE